MGGVIFINKKKASVKKKLCFILIEKKRDFCVFFFIVLFTRHRSTEWKEYNTCKCRGSHTHLMLCIFFSFLFFFSSLTDGREWNTAKERDVTGQPAWYYWIMIKYWKLCIQTASSIQWIPKNSFFFISFSHPLFFFLLFLVLLDFI